MSLVVHQEGVFSLFKLSGVVSGTFQPLLACCGLFRVVPFFTSKTSENDLICKFTMNQLHVDFITKDCRRHYKVGQLKVGQVLQFKTGITKWDNFYLKVGQ